jgi:hypothetical protein
MRLAPLALRRSFILLAVAATAACGHSDTQSDVASADASDVPRDTRLADAPSGDTGVADDSAVVADASDANTGTDAMTCPGLVPPHGDGGVELDRIASNFDTAAWILDDGHVPPSAAPDPIGAFRFICNPSHESYDDPIVFPCQPGRSHLHEFFGNSLANAYSTYETLRTTGESTCMNALNRSSYWVPAMMNGHGRVVRPDYAAIYYKNYPVDSPECQHQGTACVPLPRGLRFVFGFSLENPATAPNSQTWFNCDGPTAEPGHYIDIIEAAAHCPSGNKLGAVVFAPSCWNGHDLDSPDHQSHLAYASYGDWGYLRCPVTHPYIIPQFTIGVWWTTDDDLDRSGTWTPGVTSTWHLSSDENADGTIARPGTSFHADWFGAWDDDTMDRWMTHCINGLLNCSGGQLGDGMILRNFSGFSWTANPRVVDAPPRP